MPSIARTTVGSNCEPAHRSSSARASAAAIGFLYDRAEVITSKASATATIRAERVIDVPRSPYG